MMFNLFSSRSSESANINMNLAKEKLDSIFEEKTPSAHDMIEALSNVISSLSAEELSGYLVRIENKASAFSDQDKQDFTKLYIDSLESIKNNDAIRDFLSQRAQGFFEQGIVNAEQYVQILQHCNPDQDVLAVKYQQSLLGNALSFSQKLELFYHTQSFFKHEFFTSTFLEIIKPLAKRDNHKELKLQGKDSTYLFELFQAYYEQNSSSNADDQATVRTVVSTCYENDIFNDEQKLALDILDLQYHPDHFAVWLEHEENNPFALYLEVQKRLSDLTGKAQSQQEVGLLTQLIAEMSPHLVLSSRNFERLSLLSKEEIKTLSTDHPDLIKVYQDYQSASPENQKIYRAVVEGSNLEEICQAHPLQTKKDIAFFFLNRDFQSTFFQQKRNLLISEYVASLTSAHDLDEFIKVLEANPSVKLDAQATNYIQAFEQRQKDFDKKIKSVSNLQKLNDLIQQHQSQFQGWTDDQLGQLFIALKDRTEAFANSATINTPELKALIDILVHIEEQIAAIDPQSMSDDQRLIQNGLENYKKNLASNKKILGLQDMLPPKEKEQLEQHLRMHLTQIAQKAPQKSRNALFMLIRFFYQMLFGQKNHQEEKISEQIIEEMSKTPQGILWDLVVYDKIPALALYLGSPASIAEALNYVDLTPAEASTLIVKSAFVENNTVDSNLILEVYAKTQPLPKEAKQALQAQLYWASNKSDDEKQQFIQNLSEGLHIFRLIEAAQSPSLKEGYLLLLKAKLDQKPNWFEEAVLYDTEQAQKLLKLIVANPTFFSGSTYETIQSSDKSPVDLILTELQGSSLSNQEKQQSAYFLQIRQTDMNQDQLMTYFTWLQKNPQLFESSSVLYNNMIRETLESIWVVLDSKTDPVGHTEFLSRLDYLVQKDQRPDFYSKVIETLKEYTGDDKSYYRTNLFEMMKKQTDLSLIQRAHLFELAQKYESQIGNMTPQDFYSKEILQQYQPKDILEFLKNEGLNQDLVFDSLDVLFAKQNRDENMQMLEKLKSPEHIQYLDAYMSSQRTISPEYKTNYTQFHSVRLEAKSKADIENGGKLIQELMQDIKALEAQDRHLSDLDPIKYRPERLLEMAAYYRSEMKKTSGIDNILQYHRKISAIFDYLDSLDQETSNIIVPNYKEKSKAEERTYSAFRKRLYENNFPEALTKYADEPEKILKAFVALSHDNGGQEYFVQQMFALIAKNTELLESYLEASLKDFAEDSEISQEYRTALFKAILSVDKEQHKKLYEKMKSLLRGESPSYDVETLLAVSFENQEEREEFMKDKSLGKKEGLGARVSTLHKTGAQRRVSLLTQPGERSATPNIRPQ